MKTLYERLAWICTDRNPSLGKARPKDIEELLKLSSGRPTQIKAKGEAARPAFGDEVAACAMAKGAKSGDPGLHAVLDSCEMEVQAKRDVEDAARAVAIQCLEDGSKRMDDKVSTASDISRAVAAVCRDRWRYWMMASGASARIMSDYPQQYVLDMISVMVLDHRSKKKSK